MVGTTVSISKADLEDEYCRSLGAERVFEMLIGAHVADKSAILSSSQAFICTMLTLARGNILTGFSSRVLNEAMCLASWQKQSEIEEEHRVLLVMLSRARHGVILSHSDSMISKKVQPYSTRVSTWGNELRSGLITDQTGLFENLARMPEQSS